MHSISDSNISSENICLFENLLPLFLDIPKCKKFAEKINERIILNIELVQFSQIDTNQLHKNIFAKLTDRQTFLSARIYDRTCMFLAFNLLIRVVVKLTVI